MRLFFIFLILAPFTFSTLLAEEGSPQKKFRFRLNADPATLDWTLAHSSHETYIIMNLMEGLVEEGTDLKPRPALAERWEISPDGKTYTFYLRSEVKWSDGAILNSSHFVNSWLRLLDPKTKSSYASFLFDVENAEAFHTGKLKDRSRVGVKALSDLKFQVRLRERVPYFLHIPSFWVTFPIRSDLLKKGGRATLGPYLLSRWEKGKLLELKRNPNYFMSDADFLKSPEIIEAIVEPSDAKARELFAAGKIDVLLGATTEDLIQPKQGDKFKGSRVEQFPYLATYYLGFNVESGVLKNPDARKAIALAIDRDSLPAALQGGQIPAKSWLPPGIEGHEAGISLSGSLYDARAALARAGHAEGRSFPKQTLWVEKFDGAEAVAKFISNSIREKLGIEVETHIGSPKEFQSALRSKKTGLFVAHWGADYPDAGNFLEVFKCSGLGAKYTHWCDSSYDQLLTQARSASENADRKLAYAAVEKKLLQKEVVIFPLFYKRNTVLMGEKVERFSISPLNYLFLKSVQLK